MCVYTYLHVYVHTYMSVLGWVGVPYYSLPPLPAPLGCQLLRTVLWSVSFTAVFLVPGTQESLNKECGQTNGLDEWMTLFSESTASKENSEQMYRRWPGPGRLTPGLDPLPGIPPGGASKAPLCL